MKTLLAILAVLLTCANSQAADPTPTPPRAKPAPGSTRTTPPAPVLPAGTSGAASAAESTVSQGRDLRFVAVDIQGVEFWLGGGDMDIKEFRGSKLITFKLLNKLDGEHGFAVDTLKIKQIVKPGEEITVTVPVEDLEPSLTVYRYYCHLHPGHLGGTAVLAGKDAGPSPRTSAQPSVPSKAEAPRGKDQAAARTGEEIQKADSEILIKGKLLKIERGFYVVESAPDKEVRVSAPIDPAVDENGKALIGEWIEAQISSDLHVTSIKRSPARYMIDGDLIKTDNDVYVVAYSPGYYIQLKLRKETKLEGNYKVGDKIEAEFTPDGYAIFIKKTASVPSGESAATGSTALPDKTIPAKEVLKLDRDWAGALVRRDTTALERVMADDGTVTTSRNELFSKTQYLADIMSGDLAFRSIDIEGAKARLYGNAALVTGRYTVKGRYKEQEIVGQQRYSSLYIRQQGAWRLLSQEIRSATTP
jgi:ketosteroid isomerase-like protein